MIFGRIISIIEVKKQIISNKELILRNEKAIETEYDVNILNKFCLTVTGDISGIMKNISGTVPNISSHNNPKIQEPSKPSAHVICKIVEQSLFDNV